MKVVIYADVICPWCAVGDARLAAALAMTPDIAVEAEWRAFQLNPGMPPFGMPRADYYTAKFGGKAEAMRVYSAVAAAGAVNDVVFDFEAIQTTPNTVQAHRLIYHAQAQGRGRAMIDALYAAYFREGRDIGDDATLADIAVETGWPRAAITDFLAGDARREQVIEDDKEARRGGVNGVPLFVFDGRFAVSGAQQPEALARAIETAALA